MALTAYTLKVEVATTGGPLTESPTWLDVTDKVRVADGVTSSRGRSQENADAQPGSLSLTLDDSSLVSTEMIGRRVRVTVAIVGQPVSYDDASSYDGSVDYDSTAAYAVWAGHVSDFDQEWDSSLTKVVRLRAVGVLEALARD